MKVGDNWLGVDAVLGVSGDNEWLQYWKKA